MKNQRGEFLLKIKTPKKHKGIIFFTIFDIFITFGLVSSTYFFIQTQINYGSPIAIVIIFNLVLGFLFGLFSLFLTLYILNAFISHLKLYKKGIFIRESYYVLYSFKKHFVRYDNISKVDINEDKFFGPEIKAIYIYTLGSEDPYILNEYEVKVITETMKILLKYQHGI